MMEKKQGRMGASTFQGSTLREENTGTKHAKVSSILKMKHLQKLATWAVSEAEIPPLGALFGNNLASQAEAAGIPLDQSTSLCQRCESILRPGINCTVRIEKINTKARRRKKLRSPSQNNVVYSCHFCSHRNLKGGTPKGYVKDLLTARQSLNPDSVPSHEGSAAKLKIPLKLESRLELRNCSTPGSDSIKGTPFTLTPLLKSESVSQKKRISCASTRSELQSGAGPLKTDSGKGNGGSNKRRRRGWSSLKDIAQRNEAEKSRLSISSMAIPFQL